jgi:hypothetical protein
MLLDLGLLGYLEGVIDLDAQVADCGLKLGVTQKQLYRAQILRSPIDQRESPRIS